MKSKFCIVLALLMVGLGALPAVTQERSIDQRVLPTVSEDIDRPSVEVTVEVTRTAPPGADETSTAVVILTPNVDVDAAELEISVGGVVVAESVEGLQPGEPQKPSALGVPITQTFRGEITEITRGELRVFQVPFRITETGRGLIAANVSSRADGRSLLFSESGFVFVLATDAEVLSGGRGFKYLEAELLRRELIGRQTLESEIDKAVERMMREGATSEKRVSPPPDDFEPEDPGNSINIQGQIQFTDLDGDTHPVRFVTVQIWDEEAGPTDDLVTSTTTDGNGNYSVTVDDVDGDGTGRDIYVIVQAEGTTVRVEEFGANPNVPSGQVWEIDSLPAIVDVPDGSTVTINVTAGNNIANPAAVAFEAYEAANYVSRYLPTLGEPLPGQVNLRYPRPGTDSSNYNPAGQFVRLGVSDVHDWDNIMHEYNHHLQNLYGTDDSPGGSHALNENLCSSRGKDDGTKLAWGEAWPTFFGTLVQAELNLGALGIPDVGDTQYTDTKPVGSDLEYDLEILDALSSNGEGNEVAVQRTLWDLYDGADDARDVGVSRPPQELWDVIVDNQTVTMSEFWNALIASRTFAEIAAFGAILADQNIGPETASPPSGTTYSGGPTPAFSWIVNAACDTGGNARSSVRFFNDDFTALIWDSPFQTGTNFTPTDAQRDLIFAGPQGTLRWLVVNRDLSAPQTGDYYGDARTIVDDFELADLSVAKADSHDPVAAGAMLVYTISVMNSGPHSAAEAQVEDSLPAGGTYVSDTGGCAHAAGTVSCDVNDLMPSETNPIDITVQIDPLLVDNTGSATISNEVTVTSVSGDDPDLTNNTATEDTLVLPGCGGMLATIVGTPANDNVLDTPADDVIATLAGDDTVVARRGGNDAICGGGGNDTVLSLAGNNEIDTGPGDDNVGAGPGDDAINAGPGDGSIVARSGDDAIDAGDGDDHINAGSGSDAIDAGPGDDNVGAGPGDDAIDAGPGNDSVAAGSGDDAIDAGSGDDTVGAGAGDDTIDAGPGDDNVNAGPGDDLIDGGPGTDTCVNGEVVIQCE